MSKVFPSIHLKFVCSETTLSCRSGKIQAVCALGPCNVCKSSCDNHSVLCSCERDRRAQQVWTLRHRHRHTVHSSHKHKQQGLCNLPDELQGRIKLKDTAGTSLVYIHIYCILTFSKLSHPCVT